MNRNNKNYYRLYKREVPTKSLQEIFYFYYEE